MILGISLVVTRSYANDAPSAGVVVVSASASNPTLTYSTFAQPIPGMWVTIVLNRSTMVVITFSAEMMLSEPPLSGENGIVVAIQVDGFNLPPAVSYTASQSYGTHSFTWTVIIQPGRHSIVAVWNLCQIGCGRTVGFVAGRQLTVWFSEPYPSLDE